MYYFEKNSRKSTLTYVMIQKINKFNKCNEKRIYIQDGKEVELMRALYALCDAMRYLMHAGYLDIAVLQ